MSVWKYVFFFCFFFGSMCVCLNECIPALLMCYLKFLTDDLALICSDLASTEALTYIFAYSS